MKLKLHAIRHKTNGTYMPVRQSGQGTTWVEFADPTKHAPRLFADARYAHAVLTRWLKGPTRREAIDPEAQAYGQRGRDTPTTIVTYDIGRMRADYEVIEVCLEVPEIGAVQVDTAGAGR